jgi:hypothetical protein
VWKKDVGGCRGVGVRNKKERNGKNVQRSAIGEFLIIEEVPWTKYHYKVMGGKLSPKFTLKK